MSRYLFEVVRFLLIMFVFVGICAYFSLPDWTAVLAVVLACVVHSRMIGGRS